MQGCEGVSRAHPVVARGGWRGGRVRDTARDRCPGRAEAVADVGAVVRARALAAVPGSPSADGRAARGPVGLLPRGPGSGQAVLSPSVLNGQPGRAQPSATPLKLREC